MQSTDIDGLDLVQDCSISSALAVEILQSCTKPSISSCVEATLFTAQTPASNFELVHPISSSCDPECWTSYLFPGLRVTRKYSVNSSLGPISIWRRSFLVWGFLLFRWNHLIFIVGMPISLRWHLYIEIAASIMNPQSHLYFATSIIQLPDHLVTSWILVSIGLGNGLSSV